MRLYSSVAYFYSFISCLTNVPHSFQAVYKTCNRTKPNRTYGNYRTYPAEPTEIIEHPDRTYGNYDLSIPGINCITCQNDQNFEDQAPISLFTKDFM